MPGVAAGNGSTHPCIVHVVARQASTGTPLRAWISSVTDLGCGPIEPVTFTSRVGPDRTLELGRPAQVALARAAYPQMVTNTLIIGLGR